MTDLHFTPPDADGNRTALTSREMMAAGRAASTAGRLRQHDRRTFARLRRHRVARYLLLAAALLALAGLLFASRDARPGTWERAEFPEIGRGEE